LPGSCATDTLLHDVPIGLHVAEMQGLHAAINPVSGDFSIPCKGLMIRGGELAEPVTGVAISGNLFDLLRDVDGVGDDFTWVFSGAIVGTPTFRVRNVKVGSAG
ncbi:MAG TPA: metallopeptidase TldD-related protein, partial [Candidatus Latescibacteria bacterium]|nr:metallopeptidase TldD-related protein [Candidatus Latescibacterota bacterium]